jgi:CheY-like chemotaxis protein
MPDHAVRTVAVFNASDDTVEMLTTMLSARGYRAIARHADAVKSGETDFIAFLEAHQPDGIIWDIAPPYDRNWNFFKLLRTIGPLARCALVLTTTHKQHLDALAGLDTGAVEIIGKPYDLGVIVDAVGRGIDEKLNAGSRAFGQARNDL